MSDNSNVIEVWEPKDNLADVLQELEHLRYMLDGTAYVTTQEASDKLQQIILRLERVTGFDFYPKEVRDE